VIGRLPRQGDETFARFVGVACFDGAAVEAYGAGSTVAVMSLVAGGDASSAASRSSSAPEGSAASVERGGGGESAPLGTCGSSVDRAIMERGVKA